MGSFGSCLGLLFSGVASWVNFWGCSFILGAREWAPRVLKRTDSMQLRPQGLYSLLVHHPAARLGRILRTQSRRIRGKKSQYEQKTSLPKVSAWRYGRVLPPPRLAALSKRNGNVTLAELGVLASLASTCSGNSTLFEIGTFDGRTTMNLALNAPVSCSIVTLDLPKATSTRFDLAKGERHMVEKDASGDWFRQGPYLNPVERDRIQQVFGDSAQFDFSPYESKCSLFFVDGSHSYDYAKQDSLQALRCVAPNGTIVWHDYGVWEGVTRALEELARDRDLPLVHLAGTSLVVWSGEKGLAPSR